jgi:hypothetical protein
MAAATVELTDLPALCLATIAEFLGSLCHADNDRLLMRTEIDLARDALALWVTSRAVRVALAVPLAADIVPFVHVGFGIPWVHEDPNGRSVIGLMSHMRVPLLSEGRDASGGPMLSRQALAHMDLSDARHSFRRDILFDLGPEVLARLTTTTTTPGGRRYLPMRRRLLELLGPDSATHAKHAKRLREEHRARCELRREALDCALRLRGFTRRHNSQAAMTFACGHDADRDVPSSSSTLAEAVRLTEFDPRRCVFADVVAVNPAQRREGVHAPRVLLGVFVGEHEELADEHDGVGTLVAPRERRERALALGARCVI